MLAFPNVGSFILEIGGGEYRGQVIEWENIMRVG